MDAASRIDETDKRVETQAIDPITMRRQGAIQGNNSYNAGRVIQTGKEKRHKGKYKKGDRYEEA